LGWSQQPKWTTKGGFESEHVPVFPFFQKNTSEARNTCAVIWARKYICLG